MSKLENLTYLADRLMMGPDGTVCRLDGPNTVPSARRVRDGGQGAGCFSYSPSVTRMDSGEGTGCFRFRAEAPRRGGGEAGGCFRFSAETAHRDGGLGGGCFAY